MLCWCYVKSVYCFDIVVVIALLGSDLGITIIMRLYSYFV